MNNNELLIEGKIREARFVNRPNRFLVNLIPDGKSKSEPAFLHDPGRMKELLLPNVKLFIRKPLNISDRKTKWDILAVEHEKRLVVIKSNLPNSVATFAISKKLIKELYDYTITKPEISVGRSRLDFLLTNNDQKCYLEVKGVTLVKGTTAYFPDAPTERGVRHLQELIDIHESGDKAAILFICMRDDPLTFLPNEETDPLFAKKLIQANKIGIDILCYKIKPVIRNESLYLQFIDKVKVGF